MTQVRARTVRRGLEATRAQAPASVAHGRAALDGARADLAEALAGLAETDFGDNDARNVAERLESLERLLERALANWPS